MGGTLRTQQLWLSPQAFLSRCDCGNFHGHWPKSGGVSNVDIDGNNAFQIKAIRVVISTFETLPPAQWQGDREGQRFLTTKSAGMWESANLQHDHLLKL